MRSKKALALIALAILLIIAITTLIVQIRKVTEISDAELITPKSITIDSSIDKVEADKMIRAARLYYTFWNTGQTKYLDAVVAATFVDETLPKGHPQGPSGLTLTSYNLRNAMPDFHCTVEELIITGDRITARLTLNGTSTGNFMNHPPTNKPVEFIAIDILKLKNGKLVEDWHLEDRLALLEQLNIVNLQ